MDGDEHANRVMDDGEDDGESAKQRKWLWVERGAGAGGGACTGAVGCEKTDDQAVAAAVRIHQPSSLTAHPSHPRPPALKDRDRGGG